MISLIKKFFLKIAINFFFKNTLFCISKHSTMITFYYMNVLMDLFWILKWNDSNTSWDKIWKVWFQYCKELWWHSTRPFSSSAASQEQEVIWLVLWSFSFLFAHLLNSTTKHDTGQPPPPVATKIDLQHSNPWSIRIVLFS